MFRKIGFYLFVALILVACNQTDDNPGELFLSAKQAVSQLLPVSTRISFDTPVPGLIPEPESTATLAPDSFLFGDPPENEVSSYTLEHWEGEDAWNIFIGEPPLFPDNTEGQSYDEQYDWPSVKITLLQEITGSFPNSSYYSNAVNGLLSPGNYGFEPVPVENFRSELEKKLNQTPDMLITRTALDSIISSQLQQNDIQVMSVIPADNLLGDGSPGWVLDIRNSNYGGIILALTGKPGEYRVVSPHENWTKAWWSDYQVFVYDLNTNSVPEIAFQESTWGAGMTHHCGEYFELYEWNGKSFTNLIPDIGTSANTYSGGCLGFEIVDGSNGTKAIITGYLVGSSCLCCNYGGGAGVGSLVIERRYEWNGTFFALASIETLSLEDSMPDELSMNKCTLSWVNEAGAANGQAFQLLPILLAETNPELTDGFRDQFGPAYLDYFMFKLGTWYAMRGNQPKALDLLNQVRNNPLNQNYDAASQLADAFLQGYPGTSTYAGCLAAGKVLDIYSFPGDDHHFLDDMAMRDTWGFSDSQWSLGRAITLYSGSLVREDPLNVCSLATAFLLSVQKQSFVNTVALTQWLDSQQIPYTGLVEGDVDGDGRQDWLILVGTGQNQSFHLWVLLNKGGSTMPLWVSDVHRTMENIPVTWNRFSPNPPATPINVYQLSDGLIIFQVISNNAWTGIDTIQDPIGYYGGESLLGFSVIPAKSGLIDSENAEELIVRLGESESRDNDWYILGWDPEISTLRVVSSPRYNENQQIQEAENLLFNENDPEAAIEIIDSLLNKPFIILDAASLEYDSLPNVQPYLQYLLGLAYDMAGDEQNAIIAYWNLWNDYPIHPLSYVVQQKLECIE